MATSEHKVFERARLARDARFDGQFFVGVRTTGIYCRPICPANSPKPENVSFYPSAAAASEAGFRPCLRCRPEAAPGSPGWSGTSTTVRRGLRLIAAGALDDGSIESLSDRLGVTSRHLRRLFSKHLGASPRSIAHTQRLQFAKRLIDDTRLPMNEIAMAAGYGSVRRFNDAFRQTYGRSPRDLRRVRDEQEATERAATLTVRLPYRQPFSWDNMLQFLQFRATPGVERVTEGSYRRSVVLNGEPGVMEVRQDDKPGFLALTLYAVGTTALFEFVQRARDMFDLDAPVGDIRKVLRRDPVLARKMKSLPGVRVPGAWQGYELTVRAILGQQVSVAAATTLAGRIAARYGEPLELPGQEHDAMPSRLFPTPEKLARARFNGIGLIGSRAETIRALSRAVARDELSFDTSQDPEAFCQALQGIKGIGEWTAQYVAMRVLKNPDAFPASDLALLKAVHANERVTPKVLTSRAENWRPWRAYAAVLLWHSAPGSGG